MNIGDYVYTPRFCNVKISAVLSQRTASEMGFTEPTHYEDKNYNILGRSIGVNRMVFAAVQKQNKFKVISEIYDDGSGSYHIEPADSDEYSRYKVCDACDLYVDVFDSYEEAQVFYEDCRSQERREREI